MNKYISEALGSFIINFCGIGAAIFTYKFTGVFGTALGFGLSYLFCYYIICKKSGCHLNPVVSLAVLYSKKIKVRQFWFYVLAQFIGAIVSCLLLLVFVVLAKEGQNLLTDFHAANGFGKLSYYQVSVWGVIVIELILTFIFVLSILWNRYNNKTKFSGLYISLTYIFIVIFAMNLTGACINPFRALTPALFIAVFGNFEYFVQLPVFILITMLGAFLAALVYKKLISKNIIKVDNNDKSNNLV